MNENTENPFDTIFETVFGKEPRKIYHIPEEHSLAVAWNFGLRFAFALAPIFIFITYLAVQIGDTSSIKFIWMGYIVICLYILFIKREMFEIVRFQLAGNHISQFIDKDSSNPIFDAAIVINQRRGNKSNITIEIKNTSQVKITKSKIIVKSDSFLFFGDKIIIPKQVEGFDNLVSDIKKISKTN